MLKRPTPRRFNNMTKSAKSTRTHLRVLNNKKKRIKCTNNTTKPSIQRNRIVDDPDYEFMVYVMAVLRPKCNRWHAMIRRGVPIMPQISGHLEQVNKNGRRLTEKAKSALAAMLSDALWTKQIPNKDEFMEMIRQVSLNIKWKIPLSISIRRFHRNSYLRKKENNLRRKYGLPTTPNNNKTTNKHIIHTHTHTHT